MRKAVLLVFVVVVALAALLAAGCGGGTDAEAAKAVQASLEKVNAAIADMTAKGTSGTLTVADIKAARDSLKPEVAAVIESGKKVSGADTDAVQKAWDDLDAAVNSLPDSATLADAATVLMTKVTPLTTAISAVAAKANPAK